MYSSYCPYIIVHLVRIISVHAAIATNYVWGFTREAWYINHSCSLRKAAEVPRRAMKTSKARYALILLALSESTMLSILRFNQSHDFCTSS